MSRSTRDNFISGGFKDSLFSVDILFYLRFKPLLAALYTRLSSSFTTSITLFFFFFFLVGGFPASPFSRFSLLYHVPTTTRHLRHSIFLYLACRVPVPVSPMRRAPAIAVASCAGEGRPSCLCIVPIPDLSVRRPLSLEKGHRCLFTLSLPLSSLLDVTPLSFLCFSVPQ
ncbi:hypothetical protein IWZ03DRAFT_369632 [Phyllosticta citriasiana]|uniref:Transmembrane protein n=1 Tax=Phyllosticta citriasiana TaxID=595635 RepID=A0ABR1KZ04_9PEZI